MMGDLTMHSHLPLCQHPVVMVRGNSSEEARKVSSCSVVIEYPEELGTAIGTGNCHRNWGLFWPPNDKKIPACGIWAPAGPLWEKEVEETKAVSGWRC